MNAFFSVPSDFPIQQSVNGGRGLRQPSLGRPRDFLPRSPGSRRKRPQAGYAKTDYGRRAAPTLACGGGFIV